MNIEISLLNRNCSVSAYPMRDWCVENTPTFYGQGIYLYYDPLTNRHVFKMFFDNKEDAVACKWRWTK